MSDTSTLRRPHNPWIPLGALALAVLALAALLGSCVVLFVTSVPPHTLEAPLSELTVGLPRLYPQTGFGADPEGRTFGVWLLRRSAGGVLALYSRDPHGGCHVRSRPNESLDGHSPLFRGPCSGSVYTVEGEAISGPAPRGLDRFDVALSETTVTVDLERVRPGPCRPSMVGIVECSPPGAPVYRKAPPAPVTGDRSR